MIILYFQDDGVFRAAVETDVEGVRLLRIVTVAGGKVTSEVVVFVVASLAAEDVDTS